MARILRSTFQIKDNIVGYNVSTFAEIVLFWLQESEGWSSNQELKNNMENSSNTLDIRLKSNEYIIMIAD